MNKVHENFMSIFLQAPVPISITEGPEHRFIFANKKYKTLFFPDEEIIGKFAFDVAPEAAAQGFRDLLDKVYKTGKLYQGSETAFEVHQKDSEIKKYNLNFTYQPILNDQGDVLGIMTVVTDVTSHVKARELVDNQSEMASNAKSAFLANMSHEIRTPLAAILGFADLLKTAQLSESERKYLEIIEKSGLSLIRVIDDILDLSKVEAGQVGIDEQEFSLSKLLVEVMDMFVEKTRARGIYLKSNWQDPTLSMIISDPVRVRQILINLIGNAVKFTFKGGVDIQVNCQTLSDKKIRIEIKVTDTGIGMSDEQSKKLFQPFVQADNSTSRKFGGTGLGLALSHRLATALNGHVYIANCRLGLGCEFVFDFTADKPAEKTEVCEIPIVRKMRKMSLKGKKILIVDDSEDNRDLLKHFLTAEGAQFEMANNGIEAVSQALSHDFDIVLMDIQMPELDGYGALFELQKNKYNKPIIALTAHALIEERKKALSAGFADHVSKPVNYKALVETILKFT